MNTSILMPLILKDWHLIKIPVLLYWVTGACAIVVALLYGETLGVLSFVIFVFALVVAGVHPIFQLIVSERSDQNLPFIMSLPITIREFTYAKMVVNLAIFSSVWLSLSLASLLIFVGDDGLPGGTLPLFCIILVTIFVAYVVMLCVALITETQGPSIAASVVVNLGAQLFVWAVADLYPIRSVMGGPEAVWNSTVVGIIAAEVSIILLLLGATIWAQTRKQDFV
jgi:ABC-2 type transport system permease protein